LVDPFKEHDVPKEQREVWRRVLLNDEEGRHVLFYLLDETGFFHMGKSPEDQVMHNFAIRILDILGITDPRGMYDLVKLMAQAKPYLEPEAGE
jgi:hypothetical protein